MMSAAAYPARTTAAASGRSERHAPAGTQHTATLRLDGAQARNPSLLCSIVRRPLAKALADDLRVIPLDHNVSRGSAVVQTIVVEIPTDTDIVVKARAAAKALVEREHRITLSKMVAYDRVASSVGVSAGWLRKFVGGYEAKPDLTVGFNILALHERLIAPRSISARNGHDEGESDDEMELDGS